MTVKYLRNTIQNMHARSAWNQGVKEYALELLDNNTVQDDDLESFEKLHMALLSGARNWKEFSWGGCSLIYDREIAERVCTQSELVKTKYGYRRPNRHEQWLDTQARALSQAEHLIEYARKGFKKFF